MTPIDIRDYESVLDEAGAEDLRSCLIETAQLHGNIVECGSWRGGSAMFMADVLRAMGVEKRILACDSFEGFDLEELQAERAAGLTREDDDAFASTSLKYVQAKIRQRGLEEIVIPLEGYFQQTLPTLDGRYSLILIDCDLRQSALYAAETLWDRLVPGGTMLFDDYANEEAFRGLRLAVATFIAERAGEIAGHDLMRRLYRVERATAR